MKKLLFIFNPISGTGKVKKHVADIVYIFTKANFEVTIYPTQCKNDGYNKIISEGDKFDRIVVAGGDGMLHESVNAIPKLSKNVELGYIPTGTVNDFAKTHNIPNKVIDAAKIAAGTNISSIDLGQFNNEFFSYVAAFGIGIQVPFETDQNLKNKIGNLAYFLDALKYVNIKAIKNTSRKVTIKANGEEITDTFVFGAIMNTKSVGGFKNFVQKDVKVDDGLLETLFIKTPKNLIEFDQIKRGILKSDYSSDNFVCIKSGEFELECNKPAIWTLDGEDGGNCDKVVIKNLNKKINIVV